jgi:Rod binding domain-containing protein
MWSDAISGLTAATARTTPPGRAPESAAALGRRVDGESAQTVRTAAAQLVSELFFKPMLAEMREFSFGAKFAHGGHAESVFAERLDERLADAVASASHNGLAEEIARRLRPELFASRATTDVAPTRAAVTGEAGARPPAEWVPWTTQLQLARQTGETHS